MVCYGEGGRHASRPLIAVDAATLVLMPSLVRSASSLTGRHRARSHRDAASCRSGAAAVRETDDELHHYTHQQQAQKHPADKTRAARIAMAARTASERPASRGTRTSRFTSGRGADHRLHTSVVALLPLLTTPGPMKHTFLSFSSTFFFSSSPPTCGG